MFSEPLVAYPLLRVTDVGEATLAVSIADARETGLIRRSVDQLPDAIRDVGRENAAVIEAGFGAIGGSLDVIGAELYRLDDLLSAIDDTLSAGFARLGELGEAQLQQLEAVTELLKRPLETSARERRDSGLRAYRNGLYKEALADLMTAVQNNVYDYIGHLHIGHIHLLREEPEEAAAHYSKAIRYALAAPTGSPERSDFHGAMAYLGLARTNSLIGNADEAHDAASHAVQLAPYRADTHYELARCALITGDLATAENEWSACLEIEPLPFLVVAAAESEVTFPPGPVRSFGIAVLETQKQLGRLATELDATARKVKVGNLPKDLLTTSKGSDTEDTLTWNRKTHSRLVEAVESFQQAAMKLRSQLEKKGKDLEGEERSFASQSRIRSEKRRGHAYFYGGGAIGAVIGTVVLAYLAYFGSPPEGTYVPGTALAVEVVVSASIGFFFGSFLGTLIFALSLKGDQADTRAYEAALVTSAGPRRSVEREIAVLDVVVRRDFARFREELDHLASSHTLAAEVRLPAT